MKHTVIAQELALANLLNCWERDVERGTLNDDVIEWSLPNVGAIIRAHVARRSRVGMHRYAAVRLCAGDVESTADVMTVAALLAKEAVARHGGDGGAPAAFMEEVAQSTRNIEIFTSAPKPAVDDTPFIIAEQSLLIGNPGHATPKTRMGFTDADLAAYSPELRQRFALHWFAVRPDKIEHDSAVDDAPSLMRALAGETAVTQLHDGEVLMPAHPWQARQLLGHAAMAEGHLRWLGAHGSEWQPTSSIRTVYRADLPYMLKLSLGVRVTNSVRNNLHKELVRGLEAWHLMRTDLGNSLRSNFPGYDVITDPAWLSVAGVDGLEVVVRENPYITTNSVDARCVASLCDRRVSGSSALSDVFDRLTQSTGMARDEVARAWWTRYLETMAAPLFWLYAHWGVALEAHQQNSLVHLDEAGWPTGGRYRDNQGYYFKQSSAQRLDALLPGAGVVSDTLCDDAIADERIGYYVGINHLFGVAVAVADAAGIDEAELFRLFRKFLENQPAEVRNSVYVERVLTEPMIRCKSNLLTRIEELDELVGSLETQSVYISMINPLLQV